MLKVPPDLCGLPLTKHVGDSTISQSFKSSKSEKVCPYLHYLPHKDVVIVSRALVFIQRLTFESLVEEPAANPIEKAILYRLLKLMRMNIQPIFIFDGPKRPWKRGGTAGKIDWKKIDLLRKVLDSLKVPHHRAPAEAEAECARLQQLGIVDAVWSDDSDSFMFGATVLIRSHYVDGKKGPSSKSDTHVLMYRAVDIEARFGLDRKALIMFALLSGGDYNTRGLEGCGPKLALAAVNWQGGRFGQLVCDLDLNNLNSLTAELKEYFSSHSRNHISVPYGFPRDLHVKNYRSPIVSTEAECHSLRALKKGWYVPIDEVRLRPFLRERFQFRAKEYIRHVVPVLLVQHLVNNPAPYDHSQFDINLVHKRGKTAEDYRVERLLTFQPLVCSDLNLSTQPANEDWSIWTYKNGKSWDPSELVEIEVLDCYLRSALGPAEMERLMAVASQSKSRKRKSVMTDDGDHDNVATEGASTVQPALKKSKAAKPLAKGEAPAPAKEKRNSVSSKPRSSSPMKQRTPPSESTEATDTLPPPPPKFRMPAALQSLPESERQRLQDEGVSVWAPSASQQRTKSAQADSTQTRRRFEVAPSHPPIGEDEIGKRVARPVGDRKAYSPPMQLDERQAVQEQRLYNLIDDHLVEYGLHGYDQLFPPQGKIDTELRSARSLLLEVLNSDAMSTIGEVHKAFVDKPHTTSHEDQALRRDTYNRSSSFLEKLKSLTREHEEAFARSCAMKCKRLGMRMGRSQESKLPLRELAPDVTKKDLEILQAAIKFRFEVERTIPSRHSFDDERHTSSDLSRVPSLLPAPQATIHVTDATTTTSLHNSSPEIAIEHISKNLKMKQLQSSFRRLSPDRKVYPTPKASLCNDDQSLSTSNYFCLDDSDDEGDCDMARGIQLSLQDQGPHTTSCSSKSKLMIQKTNSMPVLGNGSASATLPGTAAHNDSDLAHGWAEEQAAAFQLLIQALDPANPASDVHLTKTNIDSHRAVREIRRQLKGKRSTRTNHTSATMHTCEDSVLSEPGDDWAEEQAAALSRLARAIDVADPSSDVHLAKPNGDSYRAVQEIKRQLSDRRSNSSLQPQSRSSVNPAMDPSSALTFISVDPPSVNPFSRKEACSDGDQTREQIAAARLRHFGTNNRIVAAALPAPLVEKLKATDTRALQSISATSLTESSSSLKRKPASVEVIDLTLD